MKTAKLIGAWLAASVATFLLASVVHSQFVMARLVAMGVEIPAGLRAQTTVGDIAGLAPAFLPVVAVTLLLGFLIAGFVLRFAPNLRGLAFPVAGFAAMAAMLLLMQAVFKMTPIAGARDTGGWLLMLVAGGVGGWLFARLRP
jgi:hypothetical protein